MLNGSQNVRVGAAVRQPRAQLLEVRDHVPILRAAVARGPSAGRLLPRLLLLLLLLGVGVCGGPFRRVLLNETTAFGRENLQVGFEGLHSFDAALPLGSDLLPILRVLLVVVRRRLLLFVVHHGHLQHLLHLMVDLKDLCMDSS